MAPVRVVFLLAGMELRTTIVVVELEVSAKDYRLEDVDADRKDEVPRAKNKPAGKTEISN